VRSPLSVEDLGRAIAFIYVKDWEKAIVLIYKGLR
jgi:hypothetical protein